MALRWRLRRLGAVLLAGIGLLELLYITVPSGRPADTKTTQPREGQRNLTYINRPPDLSSLAHRVARRQQAQHACANSPEGNTMNILVYERKPSVRMSYCVVPKAGCTFWIRIFRFLNNDTGGRPVKTPLDIDRRQAHDGTQRRMKMYRLQRLPDRALLHGTTRFMFARDPYSRVWSAYLDKLVLPDHWTSTGKQIVARRPHANASSLACGNDVTFEEFVRFIVDQSNRTGSGSLNGHWRPIQYVCDPCRFRPYFIGKQETFMQDAGAILEHFGLQHVLEGYDSATYRRDEVSLLTDYNFAFLATALRRCITRTQLAQRLWAVFQLNGLLPLSSKDALLKGLHSINGATFKQTVYSQQEAHWEEMQLAGFHRTRFMVERYRALPLALLERFVSVYWKDFEYFGYEKRPKAIFDKGAA